MKLLRYALAIMLSVAPVGARAACKLMKIAELPVTMEGASPTILVKINGADVRMTVDSGAFFGLLTPQAAARIGLKVGPPPMDFGYIEGLGGREGVGVAHPKSFNLAGIEFHYPDFLVAAPQLGRETDGLLGNNILSFADLEFDLPNGVIRLFKPEGCSANTGFAYWAKPADAYSVARIDPVGPPQFKIVAHVKVNGHDERAILDSGAPLSFITRRAATAAGVSITSAGVRAGQISGGIGSRSYDTWIAPIQSLVIGDEELKNTHLMVGAASLADDDVLIGADFLLSHRVYVANSERLLFFTYVGGPVFSLDQAPRAEGAALEQARAAAAPSATAIPGAPTDEPTDSAGFVRRGAAFAARRDWTGAIADYTRATELAPADPAPLVQRARSRWADGQTVLAMSDLDQALKLKPDDAEALETRGALRLAAKDDAGARADFAAAFKAKPGARLSVSVFYTSAGRFDDAIALLDDWIAANPKDVDRALALNERCWARALANRDVDRALADCDEALRLRPRESDILDSRAFVELRLGAFDKALTDYNEALRLQPRSAWSLYGRGLANIALGKTSDGQADIAAAAAIEPGLPNRAMQYGLAAPTPANPAAPTPPKLAGPKSAAAAPR